MDEHQIGEAEIPRRSDGTEKRFWYDRDYPGHILYRRDDDTIKTICIGHHHG